MVAPSGPAEAAPGRPKSSARAQISLLVGERRRTMAAIAGLSVLAGFMEAVTFAIIAQVSVVLVSGTKGVHANIGPVKVHAAVSTVLWIALALTVVRLALQLPLAVLPARLASEVGASLRLRVFRAFSHANWSVQSSDREGQLQEIMTNQTAQATAGAMQAASVVISLFGFLILMASAVVLSVTAAGVVFAIAVLMFALLRPIRALGNRYSRESSQAQVVYAGGVAESNRLAEEIQVFGVTVPQFARVSGLIDRCRLFVYRTQIVARLAPNLYQSLIFVVLIVGLGALYQAGEHRGGSLGAVVLLLVRASQNGQQVQASYQLLQQSLPFVERMLETERHYAENAVTDGGQRLDGVQTVAFDHVSFAYVPSRPVLTDVSFEVHSGEAIGIIGPSGAGKSTLVQILLQLRHAQSGQYLVNGHPAEQYALSDWHRFVAYVPQEPRLLHASVTDNIRFFRDLTDDEVQHAAKLARIHDDVLSWPDGYDSIVGPRADAVSGGQQQRICLARALAAKPQVLVLDEPTSALDPHSETLIQESLEALKSDLTLFTIAHRMSTLDMCDRVMVILGGRLAAFDTRAMLHQHNEYYRSASTIAAGSTGGALP